MATTPRGALAESTVPAAAEPTVFVVDDNPAVRRSLEALVRTARLAVETYASGEEFLASYDVRRTGCLVLDLRLQGGSGLEVQDELNQRGSALPIIFITGHGTVPASVRALKAGAVDFLLKPVPPQTLLACIRDAIEMGRRGRGETASPTGSAAMAGAAANSTGRVRETSTVPDFVANMSHELRTPLQAILGYDDLLLAGEYGPLTSEQTRILETMRTSAESLLALMRATLDLSRLETKAIPLQLEVVRIDDFMDLLATETRPLLKPHVALRCSVPADLPLLRTDRTKLKVVLGNLITNAIKFTERGSVEVEVRATAGGVEFSVTDTGIGIVAQARETIFEPFRQAHGSVARRDGGAGLGLYLVRRLVDRFGGRITVDSEVGRGSCFRVWLPSDVDVLPATPIVGEREGGEHA